MFFKRQRKASQGSDESAGTQTDAEKSPLENIQTLRSTSSGEAQQVGHMDPFANETNAAIKYKTMEWWHVGLLMVAETVSLGVLSLPSTLATLGLVPGLMLIFVLGILSTYNGYVIGQFKLAYEGVCSMGDAGRVMMGRPAQFICEGGQILVLIFIMAAHLTAFTIMMNVLTDHGTCSVALSVAGLVLSFLLSLPRTLQNVSYLSVVSCLSIGAAVIITLVDVAIIEPDVANIQAFRKPTLAEAMTSALNIILSYAGHVAYFGFVAELREPKDFKKSLLLMQGFMTPFYLMSAVVIYYFCGPKVPSPSITAAAPVVAKVAYGIAAPTIVIAGVVNGHIAFKSIYIRLCSKLMHETSVHSISAWVGICAGCWVAAWLIAEVVPEFNQLLALVSALFMGWFSYGISGCFWLHMNKGKYMTSWRKAILTALNVVIIAIGCIICGLGMYASAKSLKDGKGGKVFTCEDIAPKLIVPKP